MASGQLAKHGAILAGVLGVVKRGSINEIGHVMGLYTIAEFVENDDILQELKKIGVDYAQRYGLSLPAPFL